MGNFIMLLALVLMVLGSLYALAVITVYIINLIKEKLK